jgi:hypothetical protein
MAVVLSAAGRLEIQLYRNDGGWSFTKIASMGGDSMPWQPAAADFDGDGDADLAAIRLPPSDSILLYSNGGSGDFGEPRTFPLEHRAGSLSLADLDADGAMDIILLTTFFFALEAWMNNGEGAFSRGAVITDREEGPPLEALAPVAADLDGDGDTDVAFGLETGMQVAVAFNRGDGSFPAPTFLALSAKADFLAACDVDGDRDLDLIAGSSPDFAPVEIIVATNRGGGTFQVERRYTQGYRLSSLIAADLNGDGLGDVAVVQNAGIWSLLSRSLPPESADGDGDGLLDECRDIHFLRGDANQDGGVNLADAVFILRFLFAGSQPPSCSKTADADDNGSLGATDAIRILAHLFLAMPAPPPPFPSCGADPSADDLSCEQFAPCR